MKHNINILYIEDEANVREMLGRFISRFCENLYLAEDGEAGLALFLEHKIDIVISDIKMPKMNGIDMVQEIKKKNPKQLVIFTTAHIDSEYLFKAIELQVDGYISKPVDLDKLKIQIDKCIVEIEANEALIKLRESEERSKVILETSQLGVFIYKEKFIYVNDIFAKMLGYTKEEIYTMDAWGLMADSHREFVHEVILRRLKGEKFPLSYNDAQLIHKDGSIHTHRVSTETIEYKGSFAGLGTTLDITDILKMQGRLNQLAQAMEQMDEMVRITDKEGYITYANEALTQHTGYKKSELIGNKNSILNSGKHDNAFYKTLYDTLALPETFKAIFINSKKDGTIYYEDQVITPIMDEESDELEYFVSTSKDVTEHIKMQEKLKVLATIDSLTGIYNRYSLNEKIDAEIRRVKRYSGSFALMMFDIDFFKKVNDTYGHDVGDYVLQQFSKIVSDSIRDTDIFGRWGGEEFILLAPNEEIEGAKYLAEKIRKNIENYNFEDVKKITVSIGFSVCDGYSEKEKLLKKVDDALYEAKESGRNRVVYHKCKCSE
jgi:diguanylate cyclase (GGDEF)-like protein/PAS domain S-box-containing protein